MIEYRKSSPKPAPYPEALSVRLIREVSPLAARAEGLPRIQGPEKVAQMFYELYGDSPVEVFTAFFLNTRHCLQGHAMISKGTIDASLISARDVFAHAILANAAALILVHNHPSGDPEPSVDDRAITKILVNASRVMGIPIIDHIVVGHNGIFKSLAEEGVMS